MSDDHRQSRRDSDERTTGGDSTRTDRRLTDGTRRSVLRKTALLGAGLTGLGAAAAPGSAQSGSVPVELLERGTARRFVGKARGSATFRQLSAHLRTEYGLVVPSDDVTVAEAEDPDGSVFHVVAFTPRPTGRAEAADRSFELVIALQESEVVAGGASVVEYDGDVPTAVTVVEYDDGIEETFHELDLADGVGATAASGSDDGVTVQQTDCEICQSLFEVACSVGCGIGGLALCTLAGITTFGVASIACGAVGTAVCYFVGEYGCEPGSETACEELNYC